MAVIGTWTARDVAEALVKNYLDGGTTANLFEFELPADEADDDGARTTYYRRADLLTIFCGGVSDKMPFVRQRETNPRSQVWFRYLPWGWRTAFEIKVSRGDFRADAKQRWKHTPIRRCVNEMFFVYPRGLISIGPEWDYHNKDEQLLPTGTGAIEVYRDERARWKGALRAQIIRSPVVSMNLETPREFVDQLVRRTLYGRSTSGVYSLRSKNVIDWKGIEAAATGGDNGGLS